MNSAPPYIPQVVKFLRFIYVCKANCFLSRYYDDFSPIVATFNI